jgi:ATP-dependent Clp protease adapter protein ClpS
MSIVISSSLEGALRAATDEARRRRHREATLDHLLRVLLRDEAVVAVLRDCGCDIAHLCAELDEYLELLPELPKNSSRSPLPDDAYRRVVELSVRRVAIAAKQDLEVGDVLVQLLADQVSYAAMLLRAEGLSRLDLLRRISHGSARPPITALPADHLTPQHLLQIVLHNDHYTTMELVVTILRDVFSCSEKEAAELMLHVHRHGRAIIGKYPGHLAKQKAEQVTAIATHEGFPLLCTIEALS